MPILTFLALSAAEFLNCTALPPRAAWMACHFSPGGNGLCNLPAGLPADSLLILDDSTPYQDHDPDQILSQLADAVKALNPKALLLDFQRPNVPSVQSLTNLIVHRLPCPVAVSSCYAETLDCPIFLPPGPLHQPLADYLKPHQGREIWLDVAPTRAQIIVTPDSSQYLPLANEPLSDSAHFDASLHCHYQTRIEDDRIVFTLARSCEALTAWLEEAESLGVSCAVGLYQELCGCL